MEKTDLQSSFNNLSFNYENLKDDFNSLQKQ